MPVTAPPKRKQDELQTDVKTERKIKEVINKGGGVPNTSHEQAEPTVKIVNINLTTVELETITMLRELRPRNPRSKSKMPVSQHAWLVEAAQEKIEREKKKYGVS